MSRSTGGALGTQIPAAMVISAGVVGHFPADEGFTRAFVLGLIAAVGARAGPPPPFPGRVAILSSRGPRR